MFNHEGHKGAQRCFALGSTYLRVPSCPLWLMVFVLGLSTLSCNKRSDPDTLVVIIENSPVNLDPRVGTHAQSQFIGELIFASLVHKDDHFNLSACAAESCDTPHPQTY